MWLAWEDVVGAVMLKMPKQVRHEEMEIRHDPFSFIDMLKSTIRTRKRLAFSLVIFLLLGSIAYLRFRYLSPARRH